VRGGRGALPALPSEAGGAPGGRTQHVALPPQGGPLQSVGGWAGLAPGCPAGGRERGGDPGMASWLGHCDAPLSLSPLGSDAEVASSATAPFLSPSFQRRKQRKIARSPYKVRQGQGRGKSGRVSMLLLSYEDRAVVVGGRGEGASPSA